MHKHCKFGLQRWLKNKSSSSYFIIEDGNPFQGIVKNQFLELERSTDEGLPMGKILAIPTIV